MRYMILCCFFLLGAVPVTAQLNSPEAVEAEIQSTLRTYESMGKRDFATKWPKGQDKEKYTVGKDGKISYTKFFPAGNPAITYQKSTSGAVVYEKRYGDGKDAVIIKKDERILDYTSYWPNGQKKGKYQKNFQTKDRFYTAHSVEGKQVYPKSR